VTLWHVPQLLLSKGSSACSQLWSEENGSAGAGPSCPFTLPGLREKVREATDNSVFSWCISGSLNSSKNYFLPENQQNQSPSQPHAQ
jgi:hypothetical protein